MVDPPGSFYADALAWATLATWAEAHGFPGTAAAARAALALLRGGEDDSP